MCSLIWHSESNLLELTMLKENLHWPDRDDLFILRKRLGILINLENFPNTKPSFEALSHHQAQLENPSLIHVTWEQSCKRVTWKRERNLKQGVLSFKRHYLPPNFSHIFKHVIELATVHSFLSTCNWMKSIFHDLFLASGWRPLLQRGVLLSWALFGNFKGPHCLQNSDKFSLPRKLPHEVFLIFRAQMEPLQDLVTHLVGRFDEQRDSACHHDSSLCSSAYIPFRQQIWKFCHHLLKVSPQFHQAQSFRSPHFQNEFVKKWRQKRNAPY